MNKKMMAIFMSALMVVAATFIVVASPSDADGELGTKDNPRYIVGSGTTPVAFYKDDPIIGYIDFNRNAFTNGAVISFTYSTDSGVNFNELEESPISIQKEIDDGNYKVTLNKSIGTNKLLIKLAVKERAVCGDGVHQHGDNCYPPIQYFYYAANVLCPTGEIELEGLTANQGGFFNYIFKYGQNVSIASKVKEGAEYVENYKFYAIGLPEGISMTLDGTIGGKIDANAVNTSTGTAIIYAVSTYGYVLNASLIWSISDKPDMGGELSLEVTIVETATPVDKYIAIESKDKPKLNISATDGYTHSNVKVIGYDGEVKDVENNTFVINNGGTGTFTVTVSADVIKTNDVNAKAKHVVKSFTVYVVGSIVDADLDPAVESR